MGAKLYVNPANLDAFEVPIGNTATIGRTRENTVCLSFSPQVSRQHALIRCHNGYQYQLIDLGSRNGTYINNQRVVMPVTLQDGAQIRVGDTSLTFNEGVDEACEENLRLTVVGGMDTSAVNARPVALLVCDIRGFSTMSERTASADLAQVLGAWFREMGNLVAQSEGTIDKFIGDAVLAYWGAMADGAGNCGAAFSTAQKILALAAVRKWPNGDPFRVAVSMHYGTVTCSNIGVSVERDATIIGDAVNTVFRLESVAKELSQQMVVSGDLAAHLPLIGKFTDFGERALKGKKQAVRVYGLGD
ncbi:MAG: Adenylate/guanylate cyclase [Chthoniobacteraceae bacterium]|nr:Adenylate/guanylate cyclase [Chthoniobacteraceae bacterium]MDB6175473.1 Adenylate/guanylate cyclase [Chthoniobacteraceae bacterium]